jgi:hypothetical protein
VIRSVAVIVSAILMSRPGMPKEEATRYATALKEVAAAQDFDPLTAVAIIHFETGFRPELVSPNGEDYGLGQVRGRYLSACRDDEDPVGAPSEACKAAKEALLDGVVNIQRMGAIIAANRAMCKQKTGTATTAQWLAGYQGYSSPERKRFCKPGPKTWKVLGYAKELVAKLAPPAKVKAKAKAKASAVPSPKTTPEPTPKATPEPIPKATAKAPGARAKVEGSRGAAPSRGARR